jgi:predicted enzyme related to lactoylglutathione lyase
VSHVTIDHPGTMHSDAIARIDRFAIPTTNPDRLADFYMHHLGAVAAPARLIGGERARLLDFCGTGLELIHAPRLTAYLPTHARISFALGSATAVDQLSARLGAAGIHILEQPNRACDGCYRSAVLDPDGTPIALTV